MGTRELQTPVSLHRVRLSGTGTAELILAGGTTPVAVVSLGGTSDTQRTGTPQAALVPGRVADGSWVSIQTETGVLPVAGPLRANQKWRDLSLAATPLEGRAAAVWDRLHGLGLSLRRVLLFGLGCVFAWMALHQAGPSWAAAQEHGVPGVITVTSEDCGGKGGCHYAGDFHSTDGRYTFKDVELVGASGPVGSNVPAYYEGDGDTPDSVYGHGWGGLVESGFLLGAAVLAAGESLPWLLERVIKRWRPPTGRHTARD